MSANIYDCFMYYDEDVLLEFRLNYLNQHVHKFIIVECGYSHRGLRKKFNFNINKFKIFKDKIIYIQIKNKPNNLHVIKKSDDENTKCIKHISNGYIWDHYQRNKIIEGLKDCNENDIVIISDLDEIPNLENQDFSKVQEKLIFFKQKFLFYKFNLIYKNKDWYGSRACRFKDLISPQWLRDIKYKKYPLWRFDRFFTRKKYSDILYIENGGWHYTNLKSAEDIFKKLKNYAHYLEFEISNIELKDIKEMIKSRKAIYNHNVDQKMNKFDGTVRLHKFSKKFWPSYLKHNYNKYKDWLIS
jgi:beta-1,4-mannosyl-glycoprotein beta-1,4-N-acetylglucosaminyltransferase